MTTDPYASINAHLSTALDLWRSLTGVDEREGGSTSVHFTFTGNKFSDYDIASETKSLVEMQSLDPTGLTSFMLLHGLVEDYFGELSFSAKDFMDHPVEVAGALAASRKLREALEAKEVASLVGDFSSQLRSALPHYEVKGKHLDAANKLLSDKLELAYVRRDALRSIDKLTPHQFLQGEGDANPPKYNRSVYEFWNVNSLLAAMRSQDFPGITLTLIRDPGEALNSYFVFGIRNGSNITILTDFERGPHPAYSRMTRRPDRNLERRAEKHRFPYSLLDLAAPEGSDRLYAKARTAIVPINAKAVALHPLATLSPDVLIWVILMFDLIKERYWRVGHKLPELSYTGEMVREPAALVGAESALVRSGDYKPLVLEALTRGDVNEAAAAPRFPRKTTGWNRWMEERYSAKVPEQYLNIVGENEARLLSAKPVAPDAATCTALAPKADGWHMLQPLVLEHLQPTAFGTREQLEVDRQWAGRVNHCAVIQRLAEAEFARERDSVLEWCKERIQHNSGFLLDALARGELELPYHDFGRWDHTFEYGYVRTKRGNALSKWGVGRTPDAALRSSWGFAGVKLTLGTPDSKWRSWYCPDTGAIATVFGLISPSCADALAIVFGVDVGTLPWALRTWSTEAPYHGNSILDRIDPQDWVLRNPWKELKLNVGLALSKRAVQARRKRMKLEPYTEDDWKKHMPPKREAP